MSIHFGYDNQYNVVFPTVLPYKAHYSTVSKTWLYPHTQDNYPSDRMYGRGWIKDSSVIKILTHLFDDSVQIPDTFKVKYQLKVVMLDGRTDTKDLFEIDMVNKRHGRLNHNLYMMNENVMISKYFVHFDHIDTLEIGFKQTDTSGTYTNKSTLDAVIVHYGIF